MRKKLGKVARKLLLKWAEIKYPDMRADLHRMIRDNWYARLLQTKYAVRDYVDKRPYKEIPFRGEFQQELLFVLPFAYWHFRNGTLRKTVSCQHTQAFYFFSPEHEERYAQRTVRASFKAFHIPNMTHSNSFSYKKWTQVPLKAHYANKLFVYSKPLLVIANKYNREWDQPPINFLDKNTLQHIIEACKDRYQIVYNRPSPRHIVEDNSEILDLHEHNWLRTYYPEVLLMDDLFEQHRQQVSDFNHLQLMVYANCSHFISVHGGTATLASYFGGINIILSHPQWAREYPMGEFKTIFPRLSGATIITAHRAGEVLPYVQQYLLTPFRSFSFATLNQQS